MIQWVWEGARGAKSLRDVVVATDDSRIAAACKEFGAPVVMTSDQHATGTDRIAEVARTLDDQIVVNIQGDEPTIVGSVIDAAVEALREDPSVPVATVIHEIDRDAAVDPNRVKAVVDRRGHALYFSRAAIPHPAQTVTADHPIPVQYWQHVGLYAYRRDFLLEFVALPRTPAEQSEQLEQLRVLEHGYTIATRVVEGWRSAAVDVPEDLARVETMVASPHTGRSQG
jgi:3-deoxy-manno-octulosonate cytidylyltransferase (CMP-KDO synthetase)